MATDPRFITNPARNKNREALEQRIQQQIDKQPSSYWLENLPKGGVPASAINNIAETFDMPQVKAREMQIELDHPLSGKVAGVANPLKFSASPVEYRNAAPVHGADTESVLSELLGYDADKIRRLQDQKVIKKIFNDV